MMRPLKTGGRAEVVFKTEICKRVTHANNPCSHPCLGAGRMRWPPPPRWWRSVAGLATTNSDVFEPDLARGLWTVGLGAHIANRRGARRSQPADQALPGLGHSAPLCRDCPLRERCTHPRPAGRSSCTTTMTCFARPLRLEERPRPARALPGVPAQRRTCRLPGRQPGGRRLELRYHGTDRHNARLKGRAAVLKPAQPR